MIDIRRGRGENSLPFFYLDLHKPLILSYNMSVGEV